MPDTTIVIQAAHCDEEGAKKRVQEAMHTARFPDRPMVEVTLPRGLEFNSYAALADNSVDG